MAEIECAKDGYSGDLETPYIVFSVTFAVVITYCVVLLALFVKRRKVHPINARPFVTTVISFLFLTLWIAELCFLYIHHEDHSCFVFLIFGWPVLALTMNFYLSRVWLLWFKFKSTQEKSTLPPLPSIKLPSSLNLMGTIRKQRDRDQKKHLVPALEPLPEALGIETDKSGGSTGACTIVELSKLEMVEEVKLYTPDAPSGAPTSQESTRTPDAGKALVPVSYETTGTGTPSAYSSLIVDTSDGTTDEAPEITCRTPLKANDEALAYESNANKSICHMSTPTAVSSTSISVLPDTFVDSSPVPTPVAKATGTARPRSMRRSAPPAMSAAPRRSARRSIFDDMVPLPTPPVRSNQITTFDRSTGSSNVTQEQITWYLEHKHWGSDRFMFKWFGVKGAIEWLLLMSPVFTTNGRIFTEQMTDQCWCPSIQWALLAFQVIVGYHAIILLYAAWRFTKTSDGFYIKNEFKYVALVCLIGFPLWNALGFLPENNTVFPFSALLAILVTLGVFTASAAYPLWISRKSVVRRHLSSQSASVSSQYGPRSTKQTRTGMANNALYNFLMDTEHGMQEFSEHLQREFSIENLMFWNAIEQYRSAFDEDQPEANLKLARDIELRYIDDSSLLQVNLNFSDSHLIRDRMASNAITVDLFDKPQRHIFRLMATDSFVRFRSQRNESLSG